MTDKQRAAESAQLTYDSDRLIRQWRERYAGRRTIAWQMLTDAETLVRDAIVREREQELRQAKTDHERDLERRERDLARAEARHEQEVDRLRRLLAEAEQKIASLSPRQTLMREERETVEDGTIVRLFAPTVPSYGDASSPRPWNVGELDDVLLRLRMAGASDTTEVRFERDAIEACVPIPELALTPITAGRPVPAERTGLRRPRLAIAAVAALAGAIAGLILR